MCEGGGRREALRSRGDNKRTPAPALAPALARSVRKRAACPRRRRVWVVAHGDPACSVLMAAHGEGTQTLQRNPVVHHTPLSPAAPAPVPPPPGGPGHAGGDGSSAAAGGAAPAQLGAPCALHISDAHEQGPDGALPPGLACGPAALRSFVQVPIGPPAAPMGALMLAKQEAGAFQGSW